jgi:hypothetical protein
MKVTAVDRSRGAICVTFRQAASGFCAHHLVLGNPAPSLMSAVVEPKR